MSSTFTAFVRLTRATWLWSIVGVTAVYFACPPLLWLPFGPLLRRGYQFPMLPLLFTPNRMMFAHHGIYHEVIYWEARWLGLDDLDYEAAFLGYN